MEGDEGGGVSLVALAMDLKGVELLKNTEGTCICLLLSSDIISVVKF